MTENQNGHENGQSTAVANPTGDADLGIPGTETIRSPNPEAKSGRRSKAMLPASIKKPDGGHVPPAPDNSNFSVEQLKFAIVPHSWIVMEIEGTSPLQMSRPSERIIKAIELKQAGGGRVKAPPRVPDQEVMEACHVIKGGYDYAKDRTQNIYGFPAVAFKKAVLRASFSQGDETNMKKNMGNFFIHGPYEGLVQLEGPPPERLDGVVATKEGILTPVYRPLFWPWSCKLIIKYWHNLVTVEQFAMWLHLAGQHCGIGCRRISNSGELWGAFDVKSFQRLSADYVPNYYRRKVELPADLKESTAAPAQAAEEKPKKKSKK